MDAKELQRLFHKEVDIQIHDSTEFLIGGSATNHSEYTGIVGKLTGLKLAQTTIDEIIDDWLRQEGADE